jgi:hypothetical protein
MPHTPRKFQWQLGQKKQPMLRLEVVPVAAAALSSPSTAKSLGSDAVRMASGFQRSQETTRDNVVYLSLWLQRPLLL